MPQPPEVEALHAALRRVYADAWEHVQRQLAEFPDDPRRWRQLRRLREVERSIARELKAVDDTAARWLEQTFPRAYQLGAAFSAGQLGERFAWTLIHREAVEHMATDLFGDLLDATRHVNADVKRLVRAIARDEALGSLLESRTVIQAARRMERIVETHGVSAVVYRDGSRHGLREYSEVALRTKTAVAYNTGTLGGAPEVIWWEVTDGPDCGWTFHGSPDLALGKIVTREEALTYPIAHPNCRRAFGPRPDLRTREQAAAARGHVNPEQIAAQQAADAARREGQRRRAAERRRQARAGVTARARAARSGPTEAIERRRARAAGRTVSRPSRRPRA